MKGIPTCGDSAGQDTLPRAVHFMMWLDGWAIEQQNNARH